MYQNWYSTDGPIEISGPEFKCDPGNLECMVFFSYLLLCRGRGINKVDQVGFNWAEINFWKAVSNLPIQ